MALVEIYDWSLFESRFKDYGRDNQFSRSGLKALFQHLEEYSEDVGEYVIIDVISLCCQWSEIDVSEIKQETGCEDLDELRDSTTVIEVDSDTVIYQEF